jgi:hypothetical protein
MSVFTKEVLNPVQEAMEGRIGQIPIHLDRVKDVIAIRKSIYTLIGGNTG